jgi:cytochrome c biogenesis protein CcmG/thiol:disulfide interchange protein DsbE
MRARMVLVMVILLGLTARAWALHEGDQAPDFSLLSAEGESMSLADFSGKVVAVAFWATWGKHCISELTDLQVLSRQLGEQGLVVLGINQREDQALVVEFAERNDLSFPMLLDDGEVARAFGVNGVPDLWIVDRQGLARARFVGYGPRVPGEIRAQVEAALSAAVEQPSHEMPPVFAPTSDIPPKLQAYAHLQLGVAYLNIGDALVQAGIGDRGQYRTALRELRAALALDAGNSDLYVWLGMALERTGERVGAIRQYQDALTVNPLNRYAQHALRRLGAPWTPGLR